MVVKHDRQFSYILLFFPDKTLKNILHDLSQTCHHHHFSVHSNLFQGGKWTPSSFKVKKYSCFSFQLSICLAPDILTLRERVRRHPYRYLWLCQSFVGLIGTGLNSFFLSIFWTERQSLNTTINAMIWYSYYSYKFFKKSNNKSVWTHCYVFCTRWPFSGGPTWCSVAQKGAGAAHHCSAEKWFV